MRATVGSNERRHEGLLRFTLCPPRSRIWVFLIATLALFAAACSKGVTTPEVTPSSAAASDKSQSGIPRPSPPRAPSDSGPLPQIDATRAFEYTREVTGFGPRYMGSENHKKLEKYILDHLKGDQVEEDAFTADTVEGKFPVRNIVAKFPGKKDGIIAILGHYDTNYP